MVFKFKSRTKNLRFQLEFDLGPKVFAVCLIPVIFLATGFVGTLPASAQNGVDVLIVLRDFLLE
ncbi:hypothetical protein J2S64_002627 [Paeniglutamicibacter sulfureus]|uniref:ABC transporter permease n=1 Tax=Paeniglutamicibacter sulfureus TaxID=43666 RepID=A0ABU2BJV9_9MICC|nr:hypothetical protein [Paeniglutamicibacter sulfureus]